MKAAFDDFTLDTDLRQLLGPTGSVHLSPKAFDLLATLVEHRSRVLSKVELQERLWPDTFVVETNLAALVAEIRGALGDDAQRPRFVRTAHRVGYAFCGTLSEIGESSSKPAPALSSCWLIRDGHRIPLHAGENILGRETVDGVALDSPSVSRRHARLVVTDRGATIEDLGSKNGTLLRGKRVSAAAGLSDGDELRVGSVSLRFRKRSDKGSTLTLSDE